MPNDLFEPEEVKVSKTQKPGCALNSHSNKMTFRKIIPAVFKPAKEKKKSED